MIVIGRRLMRMRLKADFAKADDNERMARDEENKAEKELQDAKGPSKRSVAVRKLKTAKEVREKASNIVKKYAVRKEKHNNEAELAHACRGSTTLRVVQCAELGDKLCPFSEHGKNCNNSQLLDLCRCVGEHGLGLPAFGPNILRKIHVTSVMTVCYQLGINKDDDTVLNHVALGRHGEYEKRKAYDLAKADNADFWYHRNFEVHQERYQKEEFVREQNAA
ncbi:unnamed protein product [Ectocarpus sp. 4 AP-2014]